MDLAPPSLPDLLPRSLVLITKRTSVGKGVRIHSEFSGQDCSPAPSDRCSISALIRSVSDSGRSAEIINNGGLMWYLCGLTTVKGFETSRAKSCAEHFRTSAEEECRGAGHFHCQWMKKLQLLDKSASVLYGITFSLLQPTLLPTVIHLSWY